MAMKKEKNGANISVILALNELFFHQGMVLKKYN